MIHALRCWWLNLLVFLAPKDLLQLAFTEALNKPVVIGDEIYRWKLEKESSKDA